MGNWGAERRGSGKVQKTTEPQPTRKNQKGGLKEGTQLQRDEKGVHMGYGTTGEWPVPTGHP